MSGSNDISKKKKNNLITFPHYCLCETSELNTNLDFHTHCELFFPLSQTRASCVEKEMLNPVISDGFNSIRSSVLGGHSACVLVQRVGKPFRGISL